MLRKAIVFNCNYNGLSIIQELAVKGISCIAMDNKRNIGTFSKYATYVKCPDPLINEKEFIEFLYSFCSIESEKPILFPTNDHWAVAISKYKDVLTKVSIPCVSEWSTVEVLISKEQFYKLGKENEYLTPKTWSNKQLDEIEDSDFPIIAKPEYRRISSSDREMEKLATNMDRLRFTLFNNRSEFDNYVEKEKPFLKYLIFQEYIRGMSDSMYTVGIYANQFSEVKAIFTGRKVRGYPADSGDCVVGESSSVPEYVINNTIKIVNELKYHGIAEFEYKKDEITNEFRLIEINPRSWSWIGITPYCGVNLPWIAYQDLIGKNVGFHKNTVQDSSVKYIKVLQDIGNSLFLYKNDYPNWSKSWKEWRREMKSTKKIVYAEFHKKDYKIAIISILGKVKTVIKRLLDRGN